MFPAVLGALAKPVLGAVAGGFVNSFFSRKDQRDKYDFLDSKGLTPQEIAGSSGSAGASSGVGNVLGNQQAELTRIREQQAYDEKQRNLDRQVALRSQDMGLASAQTSAAPQHGRNALDLERLRSIDIPQAANDLASTERDFLIRKLQMSMGPDNMFAEGLLDRHNVRLGDGSIGRMSQQQWDSLVNGFQSYKSQSATEGAGMASVLGRGFGGYVDGAASVLGSNPLRQENWPVGNYVPPASGSRRW